MKSLKYISTESIIHSLDPRTKLITTFIYLILLFTVKDIPEFLIVAIFLAGVIKLAKVPFKTVFSCIKPLFFLLLATFIFQVLTNSGDIVKSYGIITISRKGFYKALHLSFRIILLVIGGAMVSFTTTTTDIMNGVDKILAPLKRVKIPVSDLSFISIIAIKFIPILIDETSRIMNAQMARGTNFRSNIFSKGKNLITILIPVFLSAFDRSTAISEAMDSRCFKDTSNRTYRNTLEYAKIDYIAYALFAVYSFAIVVII
ncbi:energy-coupling factor transporter transmembrane protein EcfT [Clostridia bacterium]|nr:energy-coupling factor transporter transmembrane protein EcfT [Clostridia bacterium]